MYYKLKSKNFGFTLAEVLITLGIIGVVAALTIPTLMTNIRARQYKTKLKKAVSTIAQAERSIRANYDVSLAEVGFRKEGYASYINYDCDNLNSANPSPCALLLATLKGASLADSFTLNSAKYSNETTSNGHWNGLLEDYAGQSIQLPDGVIINIGAGSILENPLLVLIDVNGVTLPNKFTSCSSGQMKTSSAAMQKNFNTSRGTSGCEVNNKDISDIYAVAVFADGSVIPVDNATEAVLNH